MICPNCHQALIELCAGIGLTPKQNDAIPIPGVLHACPCGTLMLYPENAHLYPVEVDIIAPVAHLTQAEGRAMSERRSGKCKWFNQAKGFGFIDGEDGENYFVHYKDIKGEPHCRNLTEGQTVTFVPGTTPRGPKAFDVDGQPWAA